MPDIKLDSVKINVKVIPNSKQNELVGWQGDFLKIKIIAVPDKGKANKELICFLSKLLDCDKCLIQIIRGHKNHRKIISLPKRARDIIIK